MGSPVRRRSYRLGPPRRCFSACPLAHQVPSCALGCSCSWRRLHYVGCLRCPHDGVCPRCDCRALAASRWIALEQRHSRLPAHAGHRRRHCCCGRCHLPAEHAHPVARHAPHAAGGFLAARPLACRASPAQPWCALPPLRSCRTSPVLCRRRLRYRLGGGGASAAKTEVVAMSTRRLSMQLPSVAGAARRPIQGAVGRDGSKRSRRRCCSCH